MARIAKEIGWNLVRPCGPTTPASGIRVEISSFYVSSAVDLNRRKFRDGLTAESKDSQQKTCGGVCESEMEGRLDPQLT